MKRARLSAPTRWRHSSTFPTAGVIGKQCLLLARRGETTSSLIGADSGSHLQCSVKVLTWKVLRPGMRGEGDDAGQRKMVLNVALANPTNLSGCPP